MLRKITAAVAALALTLSLAPAVMAGTITDSFAVATALEVSGIPATLNYGTAIASVTTAAQLVHPIVLSNGPWSLTLSGSDYSGPATIGKAAREVNVQGSTGITGWTNFGDPALNGVTVIRSGVPGTVGFDMSFRVTPPADTLPGSYSGTITYTFASS